jgi:hypothetical protein
MPRRAGVLTFALIAVLVLAGCASKQDPVAATPPQNVTASSVGANATVSANATAGSGNATDASNQTYDYSNCMVGMDMPGCPASVAAKYYAEQAAKYRPDKVLPPIKFTLTPQGPDKAGNFSIDNGTMQLLVTVYLNDTGTGPYAALGPGGQGDLSVALKPSSGDAKTLTMGGSANSVGVDPASPLLRSWNTLYTTPADGGWGATLSGVGQNTQVTVLLLERFYS